MALDQGLFTFYNQDMDFNTLVQHTGLSPAAFGTIIAAIVIWSLAWKGMALYRSARASDKVWFVVMLIVNTFGILEIIYLFLINPRKDS